MAIIIIQCENRSWGLKHYSLPRNRCLLICAISIVGSCLIAAGGNAQGVIDFFQMHTYSWEGQYSTTSPMRVGNAEYGLNKPNVVGELSQVTKGERCDFLCIQYQSKLLILSDVNLGCWYVGTCSDIKQNS